MCRAYGKGDEAFVRACYRKGRLERGLRVPMSAALSEGWRPGRCMSVLTVRHHGRRSA